MEQRRNGGGSAGETEDRSKHSSGKKTRRSSGNDDDRGGKAIKLSERGRDALLQESEPISPQGQPVEEVPDREVFKKAAFGDVESLHHLEDISRPVLSEALRRETGVAYAKHRLNKYLLLDRIKKVFSGKLVPRGPPPPSSLQRAPPSAFVQRALKGPSAEGSPSRKVLRLSDVLRRDSTASTPASKKQKTSGGLCGQVAGGEAGSPWKARGGEAAGGGHLRKEAFKRQVEKAAAMGEGEGEPAGPTASDSCDGAAPPVDGSRLVGGSITPAGGRAVAPSAAAEQRRKAPPGGGYVGPVAAAAPRSKARGSTHKNIAALEMLRKSSPPSAAAPALADVAARQPHWDAPAPSAAASAPLASAAALAIASKP
eukprot:jgi/Mesen1/7437/ME000388S06655